MACCFKGIGDLLIADYSKFKAKTAGLISVGNATQADYTITTTTIGNIKNRQTIAGGDQCSRDVIDTVTLSIQLSCHTKEVLKYALFGDDILQTANATEAQTDFGFKGAWVTLDKARDITTGLTVTNVAGSTTYVQGTDYLINDKGNAIYIIPSGNIPNPIITAGVGANNIKINYASVATQKIGFASQITPAVYIEIAGANQLAENNLGLGYLSKFYKAFLSPAEVVSFIANSDDANTLTLNAKLSPDPTAQSVLGDTLSQYGEFLRADAA